MQLTLPRCGNSGTIKGVLSFEGAAGPMAAIWEHASSVARNLGEPWLGEGHQGHTDEMATATYTLRLDAATVSDKERVVDSTLLELTLTRKL